MPKYSRKRSAAAGPHAPPPYATGMPPPMPLPPVPLVPLAFGVPMMPPPPFGGPPGNARLRRSAPVPAGMLPRPKRGPKKKKFCAVKDQTAAAASSRSAAVGSQTIAGARACLPYFLDELLRTRPREPTDVVIIDFDRALLATPHPSTDLLSAGARHALETALGDGCNWWQCRAVLDAALELGMWNEALLALAREAARTPEVVLVITTARSTAETPLIESALRRQGVQRVDHFACSAHYDTASSAAVDKAASSNANASSAAGLGPGAGPSAGSSAVADVQAGGDDAHEHSSGSGSSGSGSSSSGSAKWVNGAAKKAKQAMLELLLETYPSLERVCIFEGCAPARRRYLDAVTEFVRNGWVNAEAVQVVDLAPPRAYLPTPAAERALVDRVLRDAEEPVRGTVVVKEWVHKVRDESRRELMAELAEALAGRYDKLFAEEDLPIAKGRLPPDMRFRFVPQMHSGITWVWRVVGYRTENRVLWLRMRIGEETLMWKVARLSRLPQTLDEDVDFRSKAVASVIADARAAAASGSSAPDVGSSLVVALSDISGIETFVYERRELQIERVRPDAADPRREEVRAM